MPGAGPAEANTLSLKLPMLRRDQASHSPCLELEAACSVCSVRIFWEARSDLFLRGRRSSGGWS